MPACVVTALPICNGHVSAGLLVVRCAECPSRAARRAPLLLRRSFPLRRDEQQFQPPRCVPWCRLHCFLYPNLFNNNNCSSPGPCNKCRDSHKFLVRAARDRVSRNFCVATDYWSSAAADAAREEAGRIAEREREAQSRKAEAERAPYDWRSRNVGNPSESCTKCGMNIPQDISTYSCPVCPSSAVLCVFVTEWSQTCSLDFCWECSRAHQKDTRHQVRVAQHVSTMTSFSSRCRFK